MAKLLVIDDDDMLRAMLKESLEQAGYEVVEASDGNKALNCLKQSGFDLAIIDIVMPEKEGFETIMEFRKFYPKMKYFAISGGGRVNPENYLDIAKSLGASRTFAKPFDRKELIAAIREEIG